MLQHLWRSSLQQFLSSDKCSYINERKGSSHPSSQHQWMPLMFPFFVFLVFSTFSTGFGTVSSSSSLASSDDISPGHYAEDPLTCALPNT
jgi:hypothetical protein